MERQRIQMKMSTIFPFIRPNLSQFIRFKSSGTSSRRWVLRQKVDPHSRKSKSDGYRSRAAYKLLEMDSKFKLFNKSTKTILDLGFAPGAWTQVALEKSRGKPAVLGVDLISCSPPNGSHFLQGDIFSKETHGKIRGFFGGNKCGVEDINIKGDVSLAISSAPGCDIDDISCKNTSRAPNDIPGQTDLIMSDMMTNTSGLKDTDHLASMDLCDGVLLLALDLLRKDGTLVMKFYMGEGEQELHRRLDKVFRRVYRFKPQASRAESREMYFVALKKRASVVDPLEVF